MDSVNVGKTNWREKKKEWNEQEIITNKLRSKEISSWACANTNEVNEWEMDNMNEKNEEEKREKKINRI